MNAVRTIAVLLALALIGIASSSEPVCAASMTADAALPIYRQANTEYQQQHYQEARSSYLKLIGHGIASSDLFYNMGNACARLGRTGEAVLYYERARQLAPGDSDIRANLRKLAPADNDPQRFVLLAPFFWLLERFSLRAWIGLFLFLYLVACVAAVVYFLAPLPRIAPWLKRAATGFGAAAAIVAIFAAGRYYQYHYVDYEIVMKPATPIYSGPGEKFTQIISAPEGTKVRKLGVFSEKWVQVMLMDGQKGFALAQNMAEI